MKARGLGGVYQRGQIWWIHYSIGGKQHLESSESTVQDDAVNLLRERLGNIVRGQLVGAAVARVRFEDLAEKLKADYVRNNRRSLSNAELSIERLGSMFAGWRAIAITTESIEKYSSSRLEAGYAPATVNLDLSALKRMFNLAVRSRLLGSRPYIPMLRVENARQGFFEPDQFEALLAQLPDYLQPLVEVVYATGWRKSDLLNLRWSQVDFEAKTFRLEPGTTKNGDGRTFPWGAHPRLSEVIDAHKESTRRLEIQLGRIITHVFHRNGRPIRSYDQAWRTACDRAGVPDKRFHDFRRTAVRNLERACTPRSIAMKLTGHKTETMYRRYAIAAEADLAAAVNRLGELETRRAAGGRA